MATSDIYGLDFGTSNSAISVLTDGQARMLPIAQDAAETIPTLLFFPDYASEASIGERAIHEYIESGMKGRLMQSIKSFLPVEAVKCALSNSDEAMLLFEQSGIQVHETITKIMFEEMVKTKVIQLDEGIDHLLKQCALSPKDIDSVFTTGGTSSIPCIRNLIAHKFGATKIKSGNTFLSVATGLALSGKQFI